MSKSWYYEAMGAELGPISSAELIDKAKRGQIQPDTRVRSGPDAKWQFAERVKGLFPAPPPPPPAPIPVKPVVRASPSSEESRPKTMALAGDNDQETTYHFVGESMHSTVPSDPEAPPEEFEFFKFIGFSHAISPALYDVLLAYSRTHNLSVTSITRRALAEFLGRKDLAEDKPNAMSESGPPS